MSLNTQLLSGLLLGSGASIHGLAGTGAVINCTLFGVKAEVDDQYVQGVLAQVLLATGDGLIYQVPSGAAVAVRQLWLTNTSSSAVAGVAVGVKGAASAAASQIISSLTIPANGLAILSDEGLRVFDSGGNLQQTSGGTTFDATLPGTTVPGTLTGIAGTAVTSARRDHQHQSPGGIASITAASAGIVDTETQVVGATIPAGLFKAGTTLLFEAFGFITSTVDNVVTFRVRIGTTTLLGNIPASLAVHCGNSGIVTAAGFHLRVLATIRTVGASGTVYGFGSVISLDSGAAVSQALALATELFTPASVAVDTTGANVAELTCVTAAGTTTVTFQGAVASVVKM